MTPYLSICIPTYRGAKRLERLLASMPAGAWAEASVEFLVYDATDPRRETPQASPKRSIGSRKDQANDSTCA